VTTAYVMIGRIDETTHLTVNRLYTEVVNPKGWSRDEISKVRLFHHRAYFAWVRSYDPCFDR